MKNKAECARERRVTPVAGDRVGGTKWKEISKGPALFPPIQEWTMLLINRIE